MSTIDDQLDIKNIENEIEQLKKELKRDISFVPFSEISISIQEDITLGSGGFSTIFLINYQGECAAKQTSVENGNHFKFKIALEEL